MSSRGQEYLLVAFPNSGEGSESAWRVLEREVGDPDEGLAELFHFDTPQLRVGTLEKLLAASDGLIKVDGAVEATLRKIERAYAEVSESAGGGAVEPLMVEGQSAIQYVQGFRWSSAKYQATRPLDDLIKLCQQTVIKIDEELKAAMGAYQEAKAAFAATQRKKGGGLLGNLPEVLSKLDPKLFFHSDYLTTLACVISKQNEDQFLEEYESIAGDAVGYGPLENRQAILGSPVVPRSAKKIPTEEGDQYSLYLIVVLKNFSEIYQQEAQRKRYAVKEWIPSQLKRRDDENAAERTQQTQQQQQQPSEMDPKVAERALDEARKQLRTWTKGHYGEAFIAWMHVKCIRVFVEAVLLYGLPVNYVAALVKPLKRNQEKKLRTRLKDVYKTLVGTSKLAADDDLGDAEAMAGGGAPGAGGAGGDKVQFFPYVSFSFTPLSE